MIIDYFTNLFRFFTSDPIVSEVSQQKAATKEVDPSSGVKKAAIQNDVDQPFQGDIRNLVDHFGALQDGKIIEIGLQELLQICPRNRKRSDAYRGLISYLQKEIGVTLTIKTRNKYGKEEV